MLHLKRFSFMGYGSKKLNVDVSFPGKLDLSRFTDPGVCFFLWAGHSHICTHTWGARIGRGQFRGGNFFFQIGARHFHPECFCPVLGYSLFLRLVVYIFVPKRCNGACVLHASIY